MPQKDDVLFCKIAIQNGLVTAENAQKVLALCDKREREAGRRPPIGAVFSKYNLMKSRDVEVIYEAVRKRTGGGSGTSTVSRSSASRPAFKSGARSNSRAGSRAGMRSGSSRSGVRSRADSAALESGVVKVERRMDNLSMVLGIGGLLVVVGIICVIAFLMFSGKSAHDTKPAEVARGAQEKEDLDANAKKFLEPTKKQEAAAPKETTPPPAMTAEPPEHIRGKVIEMIAIARGMLADEPLKALQLLEDEEKDLTRQGFQVPANLREAIIQARDAAKSAPAQPPEGTPAPAGAPAGEGTPAPAAAGAAPAAPPPAEAKG